MKQQIKIVNKHNNIECLSLEDSLVQFQCEIEIDSDTIQQLQKMISSDIDIFFVLHYDWINNQFIHNNISIYSTLEFLKSTNSEKSGVVSFMTPSLHCDELSVGIIKRLLPEMIVKDCYCFRLSDKDKNVLMNLNKKSMTNS